MYPLISPSRRRTYGTPALIHSEYFSSHLLLHSYNSQFRAEVGYHVNVHRLQVRVPLETIEFDFNAVAALRGLPWQIPLLASPSPHTRNALTTFKINALCLDEAKTNSMTAF